jgi:hypothetical protein
MSRQQKQSSESGRLSLGFRELRRAFLFRSETAAEAWSVYIRHEGTPVSRAAAPTQVRD